jgi:hypothetical protein
MHGTRLAVVDAVTTDMADAGDTGAVVTVRLQITLPVSAMGRGSNSPNSPGRQFPVMCLFHSRGINVVVCPTQTFINVTIIRMFVSPVGLMWRTATL